MIGVLGLLSTGFLLFIPEKDIRRLEMSVDDGIKLEVHLDTDEGNACGLDRATKVELVPPNGSCGCK